MGIMTKALVLSEALMFIEDGGGFDAEGSGTNDCIQPRRHLSSLFLTGIRPAREKRKIPHSF